MPKAYDRHQLLVDRNPLDQLAVDVGNLPKLNPFDFLQGLIDGIKELTGIDLSSPEALVASIIDLLGDLVTNIGQIIESIFNAITEATGLDFTSPLGFLASLVDFFITNITAFIDALVDHAEAIIQALCQAFPIDLSSGQAFLDSIVAILQRIGADFQTIVDNIVRIAGELFGLDFSSMEAFFSSLVGQIIGFIQESVLGIADVIAAIAQVFGLTGIAEGVEDLAEWFAGSVIGGIGAVFGITSSYIGSGSNLVPNPNFESLEFFGSENYSTEQKRSGVRSLKLTTKAGAEVQLPVVCDSQGVRRLHCTEGDVFYAEFWVFGKSTNTGGGQVQLEFQPINGAGANLAPQLLSINATTALRSKWTKVAGRLTMPAGTTAAVVSVQTTGTPNSTDVYYFDDIIVREVTAVSALEAVAQTAAQVNAAVNGAINALLATATGIAGATAATLAGFLKFLNQAGQFAVAGLVGMIPMSQVNGPMDFTNIGAAVTATWNELLGALLGKPTTDATPALTAAQVAELLATTAANASALSALQAATQGGLTNMVASGDDFERPVLNPAGVPAMWQEYALSSTATNGGFVLNSGQMFWQDKGNGTNLVRFRRTNPSDAKTITPYQRVTRVTGTSIAEFGVVLLGGPATDYIYARVNDAFTQYVFVAYNGDGKARLGFSTNGPGSEQWLSAEVTVSAPTAGSVWALECGDPGDLRSYRVLRNNATVISFEDTTGRTAALDANLGWGWGGRAVPRGTGQSTPSSIHSVTVADIPPEPTLGSFLHVTRTSATRVSKTSGDQLLPLNTFDNVVRNSPDVTMDLRSGIFLLAKPGPYTVSCNLETGNYLLQGEEWEMLLYEYVGGKTPMLRQRSGQEGGPAVGSSSSTSLGATFQFYAQGINSQWAVGFYSNAAEGVVGTADGASTYLTITRGM